MKPVSGGDRPAVGASMFDTYMDAHALDPEMRQRMTVAMGAALLASALAVVGYATAEKLSVTRVGAPAVELDFLMATTVASPLAAPPPPAPPAGSTTQAAAADDPDPEPRAPRDDAPDVLDPPRRTSTATPGPTPGTGPAVPGVMIGIPGPSGGVPCLGGACIPGTGKPTVPRVTPVDDAPKVALSVVEGRLRFSPDPSREQLLTTRAAATRRGGTSVAEFCVGVDGKVDSVTTKRSAGDGDVDRICRDTLRRWRFSPLQVQGRSKRMCSEVSFVIAFD